MGKYFLGRRAMTFLVGEGKHYLFAKVTHFWLWWCTIFWKHIFFMLKIYQRKFCQLTHKKSARLHFHEVIVVNCIRNGYTFNYSLGGHLQQWSKFGLEKRIICSIIMVNNLNCFSAKAYFSDNMGRENPILVTQVQLKSGLRQS